MVKNFKVSVSKIETIKPFFSHELTSRCNFFKKFFCALHKLMTSKYKKESYYIINSISKFFFG